MATVFGSAGAFWWPPCWRWRWWVRIQDMISAADTMIFLVSPDSARSAVCDEEIACARAGGKRVIPVLVRPVDFAEAPPRLAALNVKISFVDDDAPGAEPLEQLVRALLVDVVWMRELTRVSGLAQRWDAGGRDDDRLLAGDELRGAQLWASRRPATAPSPSALVLDYLAASETWRSSWK